MRVYDRLETCQSRNLPGDSRLSPTNFLHYRRFMKLSYVLTQCIRALFVACMLLSSGANATDRELLKEAVDHLLNKEDRNAESILLRLSDNGNDNADVILGFLYSDPLSALWEPEKALRHYRRAAEVGNSEAVFQLAESHFWSTYRIFRESGGELPVGVDQEESHHLLREAADKRHLGAKVRLAIQCLVGSWICSEEEKRQLSTPTLYVGSPRLVANLINALRALRDNDQQGYRDHLLIGIRTGDPLVAAFMANVLFNDPNRPTGCPDKNNEYWHFQVMAEANEVDLVAPSWTRLSLADCFMSDEADQIHSVAATWLADLIELQPFANWCFNNVPENSPSCVLTSLWDDVFSCSRLSMPRFVHLRSGRYFIGSARYDSCRQELVR